MIAKLSTTPSPDDTPVYEFYTGYQALDADGNTVTLLEKESEYSVGELEARIASCNERLAAIAELETSE